MKNHSVRIHSVIFILILFGMIFSAVPQSIAQLTMLLPDSVVNAVIAETSGQIALHNEMMLGPYERNRAEKEYTGLFWETEFMLEKLKEYGFSDIRLDKVPSTGTQWDAVVGRLTIIRPLREKIADHDEIAAMLASGSKNANITTELVYIPNARDTMSYKNKDVSGKVIISEGSISALYTTAVGKYGAAGVVAYENSRYPELYPDMILWNSVSSRSGTEGFGFNIRYPKGIELKNRLLRGEKIIVQAEVDVKQYPGKMEIVSACIPGTDRTDQELLLVAHLYEGINKQGANDNYSGSVCILETGRTILELIKKGIIPQPRRTTRFLWVPEMSGTREYINRYPEQIKKTIAGINMDMVGEDMFKCRSYFIVSRTHEAVPSFFNDIVQEFAELTVKLNNDAHGETYGRFNLKITDPAGSQMPFLLKIMGYDTGSDNTILSGPNVAIKVPTVYLECWPDDFYHSSMDLPDKTDQTQLKRVAFIAAASMITVGKAKSSDAHTVIALTTGLGRLRIAETLSQSYTLLSAGDKNTIQKIYESSIASIEKAFQNEANNLATISQISENDPLVLKNIDGAKQNLIEEKKTALASLQNYYQILCEKLGIVKKD
jgi:hypothetical protein